LLVILAFLSNKPVLPLAKGQIWKTDTGYNQIWHVGKRLIERQPRDMGLTLAYRRIISDVPSASSSARARLMK
jgi:hypothetical protein